MNDLFDFCNEWHKFYQTPNLLDTPHQNMFYKYPPTSLYYYPITKNYHFQVDFRPLERWCAYIIMSKQYNSVINLVNWNSLRLELLTGNSYQWFTTFNFSRLLLENLQITWVQQDKYMINLRCQPHNSQKPFRDRPFSIPGTRAERIWLGCEKYLTIIDRAQKILATILWGTK